MSWNVHDFEVILLKKPGVEEWKPNYFGWLYNQDFVTYTEKFPLPPPDSIPTFP
jgi:hypothetical protein